MAIGDYSKTTYVNGVAPAINAANLNNNENKVKELDTEVSGNTSDISTLETTVSGNTSDISTLETTVSGNTSDISTLETTVSGNTSDISTLETTVSGLGAREIPVDTSSRILDLTGDRCPAIPDDPAGVTYLQDAWATTDGWTGSNATLTVSSSKLVVTYTSGGTFNAYKTLSISAKLITFRIKANRESIPMTIVGGGTIYKSFTAGTEWKYVSAYIAGSHGSAVIGVTSATAGDTLEIDWVYIGTGAYLSKLVDRAGVPWTNHGALPVDGPFGKGLQFNGEQYLQAPGPMIGTTGTIVVKVKFDSTAPATNNALFNNRNASARQGIQLFQEAPGGQVRMYICDASNAQTVQIRGSTPDTTNVHTIKIRFTSTTSVTTQFNDEAETVTAITVGDYLSISTLFVGARNASNDFFTGTIYALRADSRVWTDDEIARWSRDPYSEDSGLIDAFSLSFANLPTFADNAAAIAGKLPAGKLYKTSTGNVLVRY